MPEKAEPRLPIENDEITEPNEPTAPMDRTEPTLPIDRIE